MFSVNEALKIFLQGLLTLNRCNSYILEIKTEYLILKNSFSMV